MCYSCGFAVPDGFKIFRSTLCPNCGKELKVCLNCRFYTPGAHWDCRETIPEAVREKDRANFCEFFSPSPDRSAPAGSEKSSPDRSAFDKLFGN